MSVSDGEPYARSDAQPSAQPSAQSSPAQSTEGSILSLDEGDIYVRLDGPLDGHSDAPVLVLIHGSGSSTRSWDPFVPMLAESYRILRIDLLGHGRSAKPAGGVYQTSEQGRRVGVVLDRLGIENATVVGHSSGGVTATALAEQRPDLVAALVLVNTGPHMDAYIAQEFAIDPSQWPDLTDEQVRAAMSSAFSRAGYQIPQELVDDVRAMTFHSFTATMQATRDYLEQRTLPDRLQALGKPLLVIFGEDDRRWRSASAADYRAVADARVELLPGLGHSPMLEDPSRTAVPLLAFAAMHPPRPH